METAETKILKVLFYEVGKDIWTTVNIAEHSPVHLALMGAEGQRYDNLRKMYKLKED